MATPSPISAIRNSTIWLTPVTSVRPPTTRKVASTEMPPMSSGSSARTLANTSARITSAPTEPIIASVISPVPLDEDGCPSASNCEPVTPTCHPDPRGDTAAVTARSTTGPRLGPPKPEAGAVYTSANVDRPSRVTKAGL
jgi:hypothetical protein